MAKQRSANLLTGRELMAAFVAEELVEHSESYPDITPIHHIMDASPLKQSPEELLMGTVVDPAVKSKKLTFAEDCALRAAVWRFMMLQTNWSSGEVQLPNGKVVEVDPSNDEDARKARWGWFLEAGKIKPKEAGAQTKP